MSMRLMVLGLLMERNRHPYDIRQTMKERYWHTVFRIRDGSLYYAVDQLREEGLVEVAEVIPVPGSHRPDKTVYRITEAGKAAFLDLLYKQLEEPYFPQHPMMAALTFARFADQRRIADIAERQLAECERRIEHLREVLRVKGAIMPYSAAQRIRAMIRFSRAEREWIRETIADARSGRLALPSGYEPEDEEM
jgi:DNA-binding PadR family transcriptional regulator